MKKKLLIIGIGMTIFLTACKGGKVEQPNPSDAIVAEVSKALETAQATEAPGGKEQEITDKLTEISRWLTLDVWNEGFCDLTHYIGSGTNSVGGELDLEYTLHKLDNAMELRNEYNKFITELEDNDRYKELKYIWQEKLYPEIESLYGNIKEKNPEPNDTTSTFSGTNFSTYNSDFGDEVDKVKEAIVSEAGQK